jgi:hypothetical protein
MKLRSHLYVQDGLSGYCGENAELSLTVFEQIGLIAAIGLFQATVVTAEGSVENNLRSARVVAEGLIALLRNNPVSGSPRLDGNVIDITLGLLPLISTGNRQYACQWLEQLVYRVDYTFTCRRNFPICTDSYDDLAEVTVFADVELRTRLMKMSWLLPTLAGWSLILERTDLYDVLAKNTHLAYPEVCLQLWHPTQEIGKYLYYGHAQYRCGESEAPIELPATPDEFRKRMKALLSSSRYDVASSPACLAGVPALDFIACRHFRTPVPPFLWYRFLPDKVPV